MKTDIQTQGDAARYYSSTTSVGCLLYAYGKSNRVRGFQDTVDILQIFKATDSL